MVVLAESRLEKELARLSRPDGRGSFRAWLPAAAAGAVDGDVIDEVALPTRDWLREIGSAIVDEQDPEGDGCGEKSCVVRRAAG